jgi:sulfur relay (sulfurtransferase) DsrC/TusE family protein
MAGGMEMLGGVLVLGIVAATDMTAYQADAQMYPAVAHAKAFFAAFGIACAWRYLVKMLAVIAHEYSAWLIRRYPVYPQPPARFAS